MGRLREWVDASTRSGPDSALAEGRPEAVSGVGKEWDLRGVVHSVPPSAPVWEASSAVHLEIRNSDYISMRFPNDWEKSTAFHPVSNPQGRTVRGNGTPLNTRRPTVPTHLLGALLASAGIVFN